MKYCGIKKTAPLSYAGFEVNPCNRKGEPYQSLGSKIRSAIEYGSETGAPAVVQYDAPDTDEVDILTDPNHDFFDIAEEYSSQFVATPAPPAPSQSDVGNNE